MRGLAIVLLYAMVGCGAKGTPLPAAVDAPYGGVLTHRTQNPFLQNDPQVHKPVGVPVKQPHHGVNSVNSHLQAPVEGVHQHQRQPEVHSVDASQANVQVNGEGSHREKPVAIVSQNAEVNPDGSHYNVWESENGIKVQEEGTVRVNGEALVHSVTGSISYIDAAGTPFHITYVADENGYQVQGDHLPTPPPVPQAIARALEYIKTHPYVEENETEAKEHQYGSVEDV